MNSNLPHKSTSTHDKAAIRPQAPERGRPADRDNSDLYELGRHLADLIVRHASRGEGRRSALRRVAADLGLDVAEVRSAVRFKEAVDHIAGSVGEGARAAILAGGRHLTPKRVMQISRTHPERQRFAMAQVAQGRHPFAKPLPGVTPPFDTLGYGEVLNPVSSGSWRFAGETTPVS